MRDIRVTGIILATSCMLSLGLVACGSGEQAERETPGQQQGVGDVLQEQMQESDGETADATDDDQAGASFVGTTAPAYEEGDVDIDLTAMNADMVYATVNDMMTNPNGYVGKVVRMAGPYYHSHYDETDGDYYYVIIKDATACCAQGLEFVWDDGTHQWPQEYPKDGTEALVTGRFELYAEGENSYAHLCNADFVAQ